jgi:hypothetical protein
MRCSASYLANAFPSNSGAMESLIVEIFPMRKTAVSYETPDTNQQTVFPSSICFYSSIASELTSSFFPIY